MLSRSKVLAIQGFITWSRVDWWSSERPSTPNATSGTCRQTFISTNSLQTVCMSSNASLFPQYVNKLSQYHSDIVSSGTVSFVRQRRHQIVSMTSPTWRKRTVSRSLASLWLRGWDGLLWLIWCNLPWLLLLPHPLPSARAECRGGSQGEREAGLEGYAKWYRARGSRCDRNWLSFRTNQIIVLPCRKVLMHSGTVSIIVSWCCTRCSVNNGNTPAYLLPSLNPFPSLLLSSRNCSFGYHAYLIVIMWPEVVPCRTCSHCPRQVWEVSAVSCRLHVVPTHSIH